MVIVHVTGSWMPKVSNFDVVAPQRTKWSQSHYASLNIHKLFKNRETIVETGLLKKLIFDGI